MGALQRRKGANGEREVALILGLSRAAQNGKARGDLETPEGYPFCLEVKRRARGYKALYDALAQACSYGEKPPVALVRDDKSEWLAVFRLSDVLHMLKTKEGE